jgi:hypothetical protein
VVASACDSKRALSNSLHRAGSLLFELPPPPRRPPGTDCFAEPCMQSVVSLAYITAVSLALMTVWRTVMQQGFAHCRMQETQQAWQQAPALYRRQNAQPNHHHHCAMIIEPAVFSQAACVPHYRYRCMNDVATAHSLQEWGALLLGGHPMLCLSYVPWPSAQSHNTC